MAKEWWKEKQANLVETLPWLQEQYYRKDVGPIPTEYPPGSDGYLQYTYNPRTKESRNYAAKIKKEFRLREKPR